MSLSTRITLAVTLLLAVCGAAAGAAFHRALRRSAEAELRGRIDARLVWLRAALDVDLDDAELSLDPRDEPPRAAEHWHIATADGRALWGTTPAAPASTLARAEPLSFGPPTSPPVRGTQLTPERPGGEGGSNARPAWVAVPPDQVPARRARRRPRRRPRVRPPPRLAPRPRQEEGRRRPARLRPPRRRRRQPILRRPRRRRRRGAARPRPRPRQPVPRLPNCAAASSGADAPDPRLDLVLTAATSTAATDADLAAAARLLWTLGPLALAATAATLALAIRWQLRPLARLARQAASIGPDDTARRIDPVGAAAEPARVRDAINAMLDRLGAALDRERRFAATAAHELRTPLAQMRMTLDVTLNRPRDAAEYRAALHDVSADVERLQRLVLALLQLTRTAESARAAAQPVPLVPLLRKAADGTTATGIPAADHDDAAAPSQPWVLADPDLLTAALRNVFDNAARYAPGEPPTVTIDTTDPAAVRVTIADRGPGVLPADRERIFDPLTRLDPARTVSDATPDGFGLGLAVARTAARAFGGDLTCHPRPDHLPGTAFTFTLRPAPAPLEPSNPDLTPV